MLQNKTFRFFTVLDINSWLSYHFKKSYTLGTTYSYRLLDTVATTQIDGSQLKHFLNSGSRLIIEYDVIGE